MADEDSSTQTEGVETGGSQAIEQYACSCGYTTPELGAFRGHLLSGGKDPDKEHHSMGRINVETGEIIMPPAAERTPEQQRQAKYGKKSEKNQVVTSKEAPKSNGKGQAAKPIENIAGASQVKFVPRVYTIDFSPILRMGFECAVNYFGWPADLPFGDFLDTVIYLYFKDKGITLAGYIIDDGLLEEFQAERQQFEMQKDGIIIEEPESEPEPEQADMPVLPPGFSLSNFFPPEIMEMLKEEVKGQILQEMQEENEVEVVS